MLARRAPCLCVLLLVFGCCRGEDRLTDARAANLIEEMLSQGMDLSIMLGDFQVMSSMAGNAELSKRQISTEQLLYCKDAEASGLLVVTQKRDLTERFTGWDDWFTLASGAREIVSIQPTPRGRELGKIESHRAKETIEDKGTEMEVLVIPGGHYEINEIIQNTPIVKGTDQYRVVLGTHSRVLPSRELEQFYKVREARGVEFTPEQKFRALLQYDPFDQQWKVKVWDVAPREQDFPTDHVSEKLQG